MGHGDSRGNLQHAHAAGGAGCREGEAGPRTCEPDGSPDYGVLTLTLNIYLFLTAFHCQYLLCSETANYFQYQD